jgi:hypothetical protein
MAGVLLDRAKITSLPMSGLTALLYLAVVASLIVTVVLASRVVALGLYRLSYPAARDVFDLSHNTLTSVKRERLASLFYSFGQNSQVVNKKATYLGGAQLWFRNAVVMILALSLVLAAQALIRPPALVGTAAPGSVPTSTPNSTAPVVATQVVTHTATPGTGPTQLSMPTSSTQPPLVTPTP